MKTSWSIDYLERHHGNVQRRMNEICIGLSGQTGLRWVWYQAQGRAKIHPTWNNVVEAGASPATEKVILDAAGPAGKSFVGIAGTTKLDLNTVVASSKRLCKIGLAWPVISRAGEAAGIRARTR